MSFSSDLYAFLTADGTLSGLVSNRIHPNRVPPNETFPYIRVQRVSNTPQITLAGYNAHNEPTVQISIFSRTYDPAISIRDRLFALFDGYHATMGTTVIQHVVPAGDQEFWEDGEPEGHHHFPVDFTFLINV